MKLIKDERTIELKKGMVEVTRVTTEEYDSEQFLRQLAALKQQRNQMKKKLSEPMEKIIKQIKASKKKELTELKKIIGQLAVAEKRVQAIRDEELEKGRQELAKVRSKNDNKKKDN